jgi:membrane protease YdiL (CAAX protease family)
MNTDDSVAIPFLAVVLLLMPALGLLSWYRLKSGKVLPQKKKRLQSAMAAQILLLVFALAVASHEGITLFPRNLPSTLECILGGGFVAATLLRLRRAWKHIDKKRKERLHLFLPETSSELRYWVPIAVLAGFGEECAYRGVAFTLLREMKLSAPASVFICVVAFGIGHMTQGRRSALAVALMGLLFHLMVFTTGTLYLAIGVHTLYDLLLGWLVLRLSAKDKFGADRAITASPAS